jgi:hypothetical protein
MPITGQHSLPLITAKVLWGYRQFPHILKADISMQIDITRINRPKIGKSMPKQPLPTSFSLGVPHTTAIMAARAVSFNRTGVL